MNVEVRVTKYVSIDEIVFVSRRYDAVHNWIVEITEVMDGIRQKFRLEGGIVRVGREYDPSDWQSGVVGYLNDEGCSEIDAASRWLDPEGCERLDWHRRRQEEFWTEERKRRELVELAELESPTDLTQ
jgi:hypothetical protein